MNPRDVRPPTLSSKRSSRWGFGFLRSIASALAEHGHAAECLARRSLYLEVGRFLAERAALPPNGCSRWLAERIGERDQDAIPTGSALDALQSERLEAMLLGLDLSFRERDGGWERETVVYFVSASADRCLRHRTLAAVDWSDLPEEVRAARLGAGDREYCLRLLP